MCDKLSKQLVVAHTNDDSDGAVLAWEEALILQPSESTFLVG
jgi:hypothetical protein